MRFGNFEALLTTDGKPWLLGGGAFGKTYKARHAFLNRVVALKVLHERFADEPRARKRFLLEAQAAHDLKHPHIAEVIDFGEQDGSLYYAMEFCSGGDLGGYLRKHGSLSPQAALKFARQICEALAYAHQHKLLHRDLKPSNVMLAQEEGDPFLKLIDFGLVKHATLQESDPGLTMAGEILGTPLFASPEQLREEPLDERSDLFSLGMTLWFLLQGSPPIAGSSAWVMAERLGPDSYDPLIGERVPDLVRPLLKQLLEKDLSKRSQNAGEVIAAIDAALISYGEEIPKSATLPSATSTSFSTGASSSPAASATASTITPASTPKSTGVPRTGGGSTGRPPTGKTDAGLQSAKLPPGWQRPATAVPDAGATASGLLPFHTAQRYKSLRTLGDTALGEARLVEDRKSGSSVLLIRLAPGLDAEGTWSQLAPPSLPGEDPIAVPFPLARESAGEDSLAVAPCAATVRLMQLLQARGSLPFSEATRVLSQVAAVLDQAHGDAKRKHNLRLNDIQLAPIGGGDATASEILPRTSLPQWPPFLACVPAKQLQDRFPKSIDDDDEEGLAAAMMTMPGSLVDDNLSPTPAFAALIFRLITGGEPRPSAYQSRKNYRPVSCLSKEGNHILAGCLAGERNGGNCREILAEITQGEKSNLSGGTTRTGTNTGGMASMADSTPTLETKSGGGGSKPPTSGPHATATPAERVPSSPAQQLPGAGGAATSNKSLGPLIAAASVVMLIVATVIAVLIMKPWQRSPDPQPPKQPEVSKNDPPKVDPPKVEPPKTEPPKPKFPKELVFTKGIRPQNVLVKINGTEAKLDFSSQDRPKLPLEGAQGDRIEVTIDPPKDFVGNRVVIRIVDDTLSSWDQAIAFERPKPKLPKEIVFARGFRPLTALVKVNGRQVKLSRDATGRAMLPLDGIEGSQVDITIAAPPGYTGESKLIPISSDMTTASQTMEWSYPIEFERAKGRVIVTGNADYAEAEAQFLRPLNDQAATVEETAAEKTPQRVALQGSGSTAQMDLPTGVYRVRLVSPNPNVTPHLVAEQWEVTGATNAQLPAAPEGWSGTWECEYEMKLMGETLKASRKITFEMGLQKGRAHTLFRNPRTGGSGVDDVRIDEIQVDELGNLTATVKSGSSADPQNTFDETIMLLRDAQGRLTFEFYPAASSKFKTKKHFHAKGSLKRSSHVD